jgi:hypothetical protein
MSESIEDDIHHIQEVSHEEDDSESRIRTIKQ